MRSLWSLWIWRQRDILEARPWWRRPCQVRHSATDWKRLNRQIRSFEDFCAGFDDYEKGVLVSSSGPLSPGFRRLSFQTDSNEATNFEKGILNGCFTEPSTLSSTRDCLLPSALPMSGRTRSPTNLRSVLRASRIDASYNEMFYFCYSCMPASCTCYSCAPHFYTIELVTQLGSKQHKRRRWSRYRARVDRKHSKTGDWK